MPGRLEGKVALATGASKGIGRATALALAKEGANVVVNYVHNHVLADEVVKAIGSEHAVAIRADVSDIASGKELIAKTIGKFGALDILVLNAGILAQNGSLEDIDEEAFDRSYKTNVKGPFFMVKVILRSDCFHWCYGR